MDITIMVPKAINIKLWALVEHGRALPIPITNRSKLRNEMYTRNNPRKWYYTCKITTSKGRRGCYLELPVVSLRLSTEWSVPIHISKVLRAFSRGKVAENVIHISSRECEYQPNTSNTVI
jgi:hypothetical protein